MTKDEAITTELNQIRDIHANNGRIFQEIVVEYPLYNIYPEYEGKPYFLIKYTENGQEFIGYGTYKPEVLSEFLKEYFMPPAEPEPTLEQEIIPSIFEKVKVLSSADSSIPISWIEKYIDWLNGLESPFSTITALQVSLMVKRWKGDCPLPVNFFPDGKRKEDNR